MLGNISEEPKTMSDGQIFVLSLNMDSEMFCLFLFQSSKEIFERPIKIV
jgi:hypothetical protein